MSGRIRRVTVFLTRPADEVLVFEHPFAGFQFPAGSVEVGEDPETAARREAWEETGLCDLGPARLLGVREVDFLIGECVLLQRATVYASPDLLSFAWAVLPRGIRVTEERRAADFVQVTYEEGDILSNPAYTTCRITG